MSKKTIKFNDEASLEWAEIVAKDLVTLKDRIYILQGALAVLASWTFLTVIAVTYILVHL